MENNGESISRVLEIMEGAPRFNYPRELVAGLQGPMGCLEGVFCNVEAESLVDKYVVQRGNWDDFASEVPTGFFVIGARGPHTLGPNDKRNPFYVVQSCSSDLMVFMQFDSEIGAERIGPNGGIDGYLTDIAGFVADIRDRNLMIEIVETTDYGRYRLFDEAGIGVEKEVLLLNNPDRNKELNRLLAELGVRMVKSDVLIARFLAGDEEFQEWQFGNPTGSVMVLGQKVMRTRAMIHSAGCPSMIEEQHAENKVMCAPYMHQLLNWAEGKSFDRPALCSLCFTLKRMTE